MSVFTEAELAYLRDQGLGRVATAGPDRQPHITPVTFHYNEDEDAVDIGGVFFGRTKKWRDAKGNPRVALLVDDVVVGPPRRARALEIRGVAELHETGGDGINPRFHNFAPEFFDGGANYFSMSFETGDPRYAWLNRIQAIAKGRRQADGIVKFAVYELR